MPRRLPFLPDDNQELLLKAVLQNDGAAIESWNEWRRRISVEDLDLGSQRLLPLLLHRLRELGVDHPDLRRYRSVDKYAWLQNQQLVWQAREVLELLDAAGIPAMLLKGLAVGPLYYPDLRLRPMSDFDLLIPGPRVYEAARLLVEKGWRSPDETSLASERFRRTRHAACFRNNRGVELDLHWHVAGECCADEADELFQLAAQPLTFAGIETKTLSDTDHLFHTCIHGGRPNFVPPIRWVADSAHILRSGGIDWTRLLDLGGSFLVVRRLQTTLNCLKSTFSLPIPDPFMARLMAIEPSAIEVIEERASVLPLTRRMRSSLWHYCFYRRNFRGKPHDEGLARYLQDSLGTRSVSGTIRRIVHRSG